MTPSFAPNDPQGIEVEPTNSGSTTQTSKAARRHWALSFIGFGALTAIPIPFLGWLWLILAVIAAVRLGLGKGLAGMGLFLLTAVLLRTALVTVLMLISGG